MRDQSNMEGFNQYFEHLLKKDGSEKRLFVSITRKLSQFHLARRHSVDDVLNEAYMRGLKYIQSGNQIQRYGAWINVTAFNIIREWKRAQQKETVFFEDSYAEEVNATESEEACDQHYKAVNQALSELPNYDRKLINLKVVEGLPWKKVRQALVKSGEPDASEATLRKRKERALKHLRQRYQEPPLQ